MKNAKYLLAGLVLSLLCPVAGANDPVTRVDFRSSPKGAKVLVEGAIRGQTPLRVFDIPPGDHHATLLLENYEPAELFFTATEGAYTSQFAELTPLKGLLLVQSEPAGCDISLDGLSLGTTPRLITSLDAGRKYRLLLQKPGYQPRTVEVVFDGRTPLVKKETLLLDSGTLQISSDPVGASVTVNGIPRGKTPVLVRRIPKGRATVTLELDGYSEETRELSLNAGESQNVFIRLQGLPGTLKLSTVPETARIYVDDVAQGKGQCLLTGLKPGTYTVRAELEGYAPLEKQVVVGNGQTCTEEFRLRNILGALEVRTQPSGVKLYLDGRYCGISRTADKVATFSDLLQIPNVKEGEHTLVAKAEGYAEFARTIKVESAKTLPLKIVLRRLFVPTIEIETDTGIYRGILQGQDETSMQIEVALGVSRAFPRETIRRVEMLTPAAAKKETAK